MRFCEQHWAGLREAVDARGLGGFVANSGREAMDHMVRELKEEATVVDFEPLLMAHHMIVNLALSIVGLRLMAVDEQGNHMCPVCAIQEFDYINGAADGVKAEAVRRGLVEQ